MVESFREMYVRFKFSDHEFNISALEIVMKLLLSNYVLLASENTNYKHLMLD